MQNFKDEINCEKAKIYAVISQSATAPFVPYEKELLKLKMLGHGINVIKIASELPSKEENNEIITNNNSLND